MDLRWPAAAAACMLIAVPLRAGADAPADKYRVLYMEREALKREHRLLSAESRIAATGDPYILFDVAKGRFDFRIRGRTLKSYSFSAVTRDPRGTMAASPEDVYRAVEDSLTVLEKQGGNPELIPPDPETGREAGLMYSDPNQLAGERGIVPVDTDAGVLGVDVPTDYYIKFDENVLFHIRTPKTLSFREKAADRLGRIARSMRETFTGWWGASETRDATKPKLVLHLTTDPDTAKHLHYSLLPGEKLFVVPPPPPPVVLVAAASGASDGARAIPAGR